MTFTAVALFVAPAQTSKGYDATDGYPDGRRVEPRDDGVDREGRRGAQGGDFDEWRDCGIGPAV